ncbi:hypothetical protein MHTCC0001_03150 [Flavobacteriaceae bacterium MHTCC 0001]
MSAAASVILFFSIGYHYQQRHQEASISNFVKTTEVTGQNPSDKVTIILNEGKDISLEGESTTISYSNTGEQIDINGDDILTQNVSSTKETKFNTLIVPYGKRSTVTLSDGTKVWINSGSKFVYPISFNSENKREVYLEGEAAFDVSHDKDHPFVVLSDNQEVEVLGTVFNVSSYSDDDNNFVVLKSGSVQVSHKNEDKGLFSKKKKSITIVPGIKANINLKSRKVSTKSVDVEHYFSWIDGVLILKNNNLNEIMRRLSRVYNVSINIDNKALADQRFSGYLDLKDSVDDVIQTIMETTEFNYQKNENQITITN